MKVALFLSSLKKKGPTVQTVRLAIALSKFNCKVTVVVFKEDFDEGLKDQLELNKIPVVRLRKNISSLLHFRKYNVVHSTGLIPDLLSYLLASKKWCCTIRNIPSEDYRPKFGRVVGTALEKIHLSLIAKCKFPVACSPYIQESFQASVGPLKMILNSGPSNRFNYKFSDPIKRKSYNWLVLGTINERKNNTLIVECFKKYPELGALRLVGGGPELIELKSSYSYLDNIHFMGHIADPSDELQQADILISASKSEGMPNSVLEAISYGLHCFLSDIYPHRYLSNYHAHMISLFSLDANPHELSNFIKSEISRLNARKNVQNSGLSSKFHADYMGREYFGLYRSIIGEAL